MDGICLQTSESIGCAEELGLPAVVALNKIDLLPDEEAAQVTLSLPFQACVLCRHVPLHAQDVALTPVCARNTPSVYVLRPKPEAHVNLNTRSNRFIRPMYNLPRPLLLRTVLA